MKKKLESDIVIKEPKKEVKVSKFILTVNEKTLSTVSDVVNCYSMLMFIDSNKKKHAVVCGCGGATHLCSAHAKKIWDNQRKGVYDIDNDILVIIDGRVWSVKNKRVGFRYGEVGVVLAGKPNALLVLWDTGLVTGLADALNIVCILDETVY